MWKRLNNNNPKGARQPANTEPTYIGNGKYAGSGLGLEVHGPQYKNPPPRPQREGLESESLPPLPFNSAPPEHRSSVLRPVSSIYSQPSPNPVVTRFPAQKQELPYPEEVSPQSSPEFSSSRQRSQNHAEEEVSPIDEMPDISRLGLGRRGSRHETSLKPPSSSIPVLRREKRRNQVAAVAANLVTRKDVGGHSGRIAKDPSWDPYTGEITTSDRGKKQSITPGQFTPPGLRSVHPQTGAALGNESIITAAPKGHLTFGERVRKLKGSNNMQEKPEWKGASGRATLVNPVEDRFDIPPLNLPRKSSKRVASPHSGSNTPVSLLSPGETVPASSQMLDSEDPTIRTVFSDSGKNSPRATKSITETVANPVSAPRTQLRGNLPVEAPPSPVISPEEQAFRETFRNVGFAVHNAAEPYVQPPSRFSVTTYATSEAHSTPRPSTDTFDRPPIPTPPMPTPPQQFTSQFASRQITPIMNRVKPKVGDGLKAVSRKAVAPPSPVFISMTKADPSKRVSNIAKSLPMSPAEAESHDLITSLQAQLDDLAHRRNNITRSIRQMTELMPTDSVLVTDEVRRKREIEKQKVEALREQEADVRREEHQIGLRLHRAWKRQDKEAVYEPTGLWVRRVTG